MPRLGPVVATSGRVVEAHGYALGVHEGNSTRIEWMAKALLILLTSHPRGQKLLVVDSVAVSQKGTNFLSCPLCPLFVNVHISDCA